MSLYHYYYSNLVLNGLSNLFNNVAVAKQLLCATPWSPSG